MDDADIGIHDRIVGIRNPVVGIPGFFLFKQWTTLSTDNAFFGGVSPAKQEYLGLSQYRLQHHL